MADDPTLLHYRAATAWLFSRSRAGAPRDVVRMRTLMAAMRLQPPPQVVQVVGSNGKGTVAALIATGLGAAGRRAGLFTSPHVEDFRERISVGGEQIADAEVVALVAQMRADPALAGFAFFELSLALALWHFERSGVEIAVLEAGIGARNDATSAVGNVELTVLTNVALDHQALLGHTLEQIAADKLAAARAGVPLVSGARGVAATVTAAVAAERGAPLYLERDDGPLFALPHHLAAGTDQALRQNRRLAAASLRLLAVPEGAVMTALALPPLPARREPFLIRGRRLLLDGAHDPEAARWLRLAIKGRYLLVFGALERKQGRATFEVLAADAEQVLVTEAVAGSGRPPWSEPHPFVADPVAAIERALALAPDRATVVVAGSLYLAGRVRPFLRSHRGG